MMGGDGGVGEGLVRKDTKWEGLKVRCEMRLRRFGVEGKDEEGGGRVGDGDGEREEKRREEKRRERERERESGCHTSRETQESIRYPYKYIPHTWEPSCDTIQQSSF